MEDKEFIQALEKQGITVSSKQMDQFNFYADFLAEWNEKINLTALSAHNEVLLKHFYDSISLSFYEDFTMTKTLVDVGSGAGFPSLPLKILFPKLEVTIVDSLQKRIRFLQTLVYEMGLEGVHLYHDRAETFGKKKENREAYDIATARAVAKLNVLSEYCLPLVKEGGTFFAMKSVNAQEEINQAEHAIQLLGGKFRKDYAFELPEQAGERHILAIDKVQKTPKRYPRRPGLPSQKPL